MGSCSGIPSSPLIFSPNFILQTHNPHDHEQVDHHMTLTTLLPQCSVPHGLSSKRRRPVSFSTKVDNCEAEDEITDVECCQPGDKKRRLNMEQVRALEKNFELCNKLEPERKMQLARSLSLQPRQIAIWFQNRRARWKTKQLEKDYHLLKGQFDAIKSDNDALKLQNKKLQDEIQALTGRDATELINLNKETEGSCSIRSNNSSEINLDFSRTLTTGATESNLNPIQTLPFFTSIRQSSSISQLLHVSSEPELQCSRIENGIADENFSNLLCGIEDQNAFWAWPDRHNFH